MDAMSPMALILVGQTELWEKLQLQSYAAIRQRIDLQSNCIPLNARRLPRMFADISSTLARTKTSSRTPRWMSFSR
jgi:hypothetical protein